MECVAYLRVSTEKQAEEGNYNKEGQHGTCRTVTTPVKPLIPFDQWNGSDESDTPFAD